MYSLGKLAMEKHQPWFIGNVLKSFTIEENQQKKYSEFIIKFLTVLRVDKYIIDLLVVMILVQIWPILSKNYYSFTVIYS